MARSGKVQGLEGECDRERYSVEKEESEPRKRVKRAPKLQSLFEPEGTRSERGEGD